MSFGEWYVRRGRIGRRTWWLHYTLPQWSLSLLAALADAALGYPALAPGPEGDGFYSWAGGPLTLLVAIFFVVPSFSATVTRLHDRGHSAWWLLWGLVPFVGVVVLFATIACMYGQEEPNGYGLPEGRSGYVGVTPTSLLH